MVFLTMKSKQKIVNHVAKSQLKSLDTCDDDDD